MKKVILIMTMVFGMNALVSANEVSVLDYSNNSEVECLINEGVKDYNFYADMDSLGEKIGIDRDDSAKYDVVYKTYNAFCGNMMKASVTSDNEKRIDIIFKSIDETLIAMYKNLSKFQYRNFLSILNLSFYNKGFSEESFLYCNRK